MVKHRAALTNPNSGDMDDAAARAWGRERIASRERGMARWRRDIVLDVDGFVGIWVWIALMNSQEVDFMPSVLNRN